MSVPIPVDNIYLIFIVITTHTGLHPLPKWLDHPFLEKMPTKWAFLFPLVLGFLFCFRQIWRWGFVVLRFVKVKDQMRMRRNFSNADKMWHLRIDACISFRIWMVVFLDRLDWTVQTFFLPFFWKWYFLVCLFVMSNASTFTFNISSNATFYFHFSFFLSRFWF